MRQIAPLLALLFLLPAALPAAAQNDLREELLRRINAERREAGSPPLRLSAPLTRVAQGQAEEIGRRNSSRLEAGSPEVLHERMERAGYNAHAWTESVAATPGGVDAVIRNWQRGDSQTFRRLLDPQYRDLGIGLSRVRGTPLYTFLYAIPQGDYFTRETTGLRDVERVRAEILAAVNAERKKAGAPPLRSNSLLDKAAQRHAQDMLSRGYFAHESLERKTVRERAREAAYDWRAIGENIAEGQFSVDEVMRTWMNSPGHRRNILDPAFKELGVGLALGRSGSGYRVLWAQAFGTARKK
ncbi:MAG TPA: CAP domain-containing protein [Thermoanaerobaculia bacterium]|nr:CAP domain-containing protein [Thermoanaerobaculia bacterium]